jgi:hypothetical protein
MLTPVRVEDHVTVAVLPHIRRHDRSRGLSVVFATPFESVVACRPRAALIGRERDGTPGNRRRSRPRLAPLSRCCADGGTAGVALNSTRSAAAVPTRRFSSLPDAPPENAVIVAVPL